LRDRFNQILGTEHEAAELFRRCQRLEVDPGEIIVSAGDAADSMHFILDGRVGIMIPAGEGRTIRCEASAAIRRSGRWAHAPRNATIQAEVASILYV
jgi:sulfate permease, SulP family